MAELDFFSTYSLIAFVEELIPKASFFKDRYFPTGDADIFNADEVLVEYRKADRRMAPFVDPRIKSVPMDRIGYSVYKLRPAYIGVSRTLSIDELKQRGFGEALYNISTPQERAAKLQMRDLEDMDARITRREEWMAAQTMITNGCIMQEWVDNQRQGNAKEVQYFDGQTDHLYTVSNTWNSDSGNMFGDIAAMARMLTKRGNAAVDLVVGSDVAAAILEMEKVQRLLDRNSGIIVGTIDAKLSEYDGITYFGNLNFNGYRLNLISVDELFIDEDGTEKPLFPRTSAMVTAPNCGHFLYGQITQIDYGDEVLTTHAGTRIPKLVVDQPDDTRTLQLACRPLAAPYSYCPYIYAADVVG